MLITRSKLIGLVLPDSIANNQQVPFKQDPDLLGSTLIGISAFNDTDLSKFIDGSTVVGTLSGLVLTLTSMRNFQINQDFPLNDLRPANNSGMIRFMFPFDLKWQDSSFITITDITGLTAGETIPLQLYYVKNEDFPEFLKQYKFYAGTPE